MSWGTWVAQSDECLTLDFRSGRDLRVVGLSPLSGSALGMESAWDSLSSPSARFPPPCLGTLFLSQKECTT